MPNSGFQQRGYQNRITAEVIRIIDAALDRGDEQVSVLIKSPVGSGKTSMGLVVAEHLQHRHDMLCGWSAMRRNLLTQAQRDADKFEFDVALLPISMFEKDPPRADALFVDEAHHDSTDSMNTIHSVVRPRVIVGMSATPKRGDRVGLCFQHVIEDCGIQELIDEGYLSKYHHYMIPDWTPEFVADTFLREPERWGQSIVFFRTEAECHRFIECLYEAGFYSVDLVTGNTDRDTQLAAFEAGETQVLVNMMVLTEGFDCPAIKTAFIRDSGPVPTEQMGGRVLRLHEDFPHKQIVQSLGTKCPFSKIAQSERTLRWDVDHWTDLTPKRVDLEPIINAARAALLAQAMNPTTPPCKLPKLKNHAFKEPKTKD